MKYVCDEDAIDLLAYEKSSVSYSGKHFCLRDLFRQLGNAERKKDPILKKNYQEEPHDQRCVKFSVVDCNRF